MFKIEDNAFIANNKTIKIKHLCLLPLIIFVSACAPITEQPVLDTPQTTPVKRTPPSYSSDPIINPLTTDIHFAQQALTNIGYSIGQVDGLWGPRSSTAIREFEEKNGLPSANGHLSELNLHALEISSGIQKSNFYISAVPSKSENSISAKLEKEQPLSEGPQLIIVEKEYKVLSKPNPYSSELLTLAAGTGIYVISKQDGYYEIESINRKRGFIRID